MEINQEWIAQQRALCNAATPGPWESKHYGRYEDHDECCIALPDDSIEPSKYENADFIAAARTALPAALDEIERLAADNAALRSRVDSLARERDALQSDFYDVITADSHSGPCYYCDGDGCAICRHFDGNEDFESAFMYKARADNTAAPSGAGEGV